MKRLEKIIEQDVVVLLKTSPDIPDRLIEDFRGVLLEEGQRMKRIVEQMMKNCEADEFANYTKRLHEELIELLGKAIRYAVHAGKFFECLYSFLMQQLADVWHLSIRLRMQAWMHEEVAVLNVQQREPFGPVEKIPVSLSVAQLGCLASAFVGARVMSDKNIALICRVLAGALIPVNASHAGFSADYLRQKYYEIDPLVKKDTITILQKAILWLRSN